MRYLFLILFFAASTLISAQKDLFFTKIKGFPKSTSINKIDIIENVAYVGSNNGAFRIYEDIAVPILDKYSTIDFAFIKDSLCLMTNGTYIYNVDGKIVFNENAPTQINAIEIFKNKLYVASSSGLYIYGLNGEKPTVKSTSNSVLKSNFINFIHVDNEQKMWLGTKAGEVRIDGDKWQIDHTDVDVTNYNENKEGIWFYGTDKKNKSKLFLLDKFNRFFDAGFGNDLYKGKFNDFAIDDKGILYFASDAFMQYDPYKDAVYNFSQNSGYISSKCNAVAAQGNGDIWLGTELNGLFRASIDPKKHGLSVQCIVDKQVNCSNSNEGSIVVLTSGGTKPYKYYWSDSKLQGDKPQKVTNGSYVVTVIDAVGTQEISTVELTSPPLFFVDLVSISPIKSINGREGRIEIQAIGGIQPFSYKWSDGSSKNYIEKLGSGIYSVTITDKNKCTAIGSYNLAKEKTLAAFDVKNLTIGKVLNVEELYFKADSSILISTSFKVLDELYAFLKENEKIVIEIGGHTNTIPPHEYCDKLSTERAKTVAQYFYSKGIPEQRISYKGYGKRKPLLAGDSQAARQKNQRVEVKILEL
jgi:outer membrane protein OmpA-like peptidoglycan-associated protein